ncbi:cytoglobin-1-like [Chiloscyllium plagiosum]|uniref:cytoglobin-1-like n=1 Tax=Chiloscyllium plagiosum TaxID=36176 RepID=UPI001CB82C4A|nr:cytoglobin-1-like [Chiloscyllium plagiosum]
MGCALSGTGLDPGKAAGDVNSPVPRSEAARSELIASDSDPPLPLSEQQKELIRQSWVILHQDIARVGIIMFIRSRESDELSRLFETHPECKDVFFLFRDIDDLQQLKMSKELQSHGLRVMSFIEKSVARLEQEDKLEQLAFELGRSHCRYNAPPKYYEGLFDYLTRTMKRGYYDAEQSNNINQSSHTKRRAQSGLKANQNAV